MINQFKDIVPQKYDYGKLDANTCFSQTNCELKSKKGNGPRGLRNNE